MVRTKQLLQKIKRRAVAGVGGAAHRQGLRQELPRHQRWAAGDPEVQALTPDDFTLGRIQLREPTPIPEDEARWAWDWMANWGLIHGTFDATTQINRKIAREAHELAFLPDGGEVPFTEDGAPDEAALEAAGAFELEAFGAHQAGASTSSRPERDFSTTPCTPECSASVRNSADASHVYSTTWSTSPSWTILPARASA